MVVILLEMVVMVGRVVIFFFGIGTALAGRVTGG